MDPTTTFCPNLACPARGQIGQGNIGIHSYKDRRFICTQCRRTFSSTTGTAFYRLRTLAETVVILVTLLAYGCPAQAIVPAFGFDERTVADWSARSGRQGQAVQESLVEQPRALRQVQADEIRVKKQGGIVWMALAMMVKTRLWLGGEVSEQRDMSLIRRLIEWVKRCAARRPLLVCNTAYIERLNATFRERLVSLTRRGRALARRTLTLQHGVYLIGTVYDFCTPHASFTPTSGGTTPAMAAGITDHCWTVQELLSFHVPPRWTPPTQRGPPSHAHKRLIERWCGDHGSLWSYPSTTP
jgi:transposase-like protein